MQRAIPWVRVVGLMGNSPVAWLMLPQGVVNAVECLTTTMLSDHSDRLGRATPLNAADTARLRGILADHFTFEELKSELCFPLEIAYEEFPQASVGVGRSVFATQLIQACVRSGRLHELLDLIQTARPHIQLGLNIAEFAPDLLHDEVRSRYLERIIRGHNYLPLQGFPIHSFMSLSLESIIVLPTLDHPAKRAGSVTLSAMLGSHRRVLLIGGLGTGKTMLIKYLALRYARALLENTPAVYDGDGNALDTPRLPIVVQIARFASAITSGRVHTLMEFLQFEYESISSAPDEIAHLLADALAAGSAVLLLDGLDELAGSAANGYPILTEIEHFLTDIDGRNRVIATSRPTGYQPISLDFTGLILHAFDRRQAHRLLKQWGAALPNQSRAIQTGLTKLAGEVKCHPGIRQLSTNPLLLTALILLCVNDQALPQQRLILYQSITRQLLTGWAHNLASPPGNGPNGLSETEMERLLGELAYWMRCGPSGDTAHEAAIRACLIGALAACRDLPPNHVRLHEAVTPFFERLRYRAGLLMATDAQHYRFALTPVQDYFAALHLLGLPNLDQFVATHCQEARWRTVIAFAIGQLSALDPRQTVQLIQNRLVTNPRLPQVEEISLALHCLGECVHDIDNVDSDFIAELARQSVQTYLLLSNSGDAKSMKRRIEAEFVRLRGSPIGQIISALLAMSLADANPALRVRSAEGLAVLGNAEPAILTGLVTALRDESPGVRRAAAKALGKLGIRPCAHSLW